MPTATDDAVFPAGANLQSTVASDGVLSSVSTITVTGGAYNFTGPNTLYVGSQITRGRQLLKPALRTPLAAPFVHPYRLDDELPVGTVIEEVDDGAFAELRVMDAASLDLP